MLYNNKYRNESIRLKNFDYSHEGSYFITICTKNKECLFGNVNNGEMILNDAGIMLGKWYFEMRNKYPNIRCDEYIVMPNHFHCIITIIGKQNVPNDIPDAHDRNRIITNTNPDAHVGAPLRGRPSPEKRDNSYPRGRPSPEKRVVLGSRGRPSPKNRECVMELYGPNNKKYNETIPLMVNWFKTMTTNEYIRGVKNYNWPQYDRKLWQQNYWDHIIRSENDLFRIKKYIKNNPGKWEKR